MVEGKDLQRNIDRRSVVRTGAKIAYAAPVVAASLKLSTLAASADDPAVSGGNAVVTEVGQICDSTDICGTFNGVQAICDSVNAGPDTRCCVPPGSECRTTVDCCFPFDPNSEGTTGCGRLTPNGPNVCGDF